MSVITGLWHIDGEPLDKERLQLIAGYAKQHGPDTRTTEFQDSVGMIYQLFDSGTKVSRGPQPHRSKSGTTMMWDGRLDNRDDIIAALGTGSIQHQDGDVPSDIEILHAFYDRYGVESFQRIIGDWALCVWDPNSRRLTMACDFVGVRHLYYCRLQETVLWCSDLGALVRGTGRSFSPNDAYIAEYLEAMPHPSRTPYEGVEAVPPGHWVEVTETKVAVHRYWSWDVSNPIRYKSDGGYEEHFRYELRRAVRRRLQSDYPVMAELSGGLDSSSIVCTADEILGLEGAATPTLHTLSYYHDEEPSCDERPFFSIIERKRGHIGTHINSVRYENLSFDWPTFVPVPIYPHGVFESERELWEVMQKHSARTVLSGAGGDEFLGGVPTGIPELADLLRAGDLMTFGKSLASWSRASRISRWELVLPSIKAALTLRVRKDATRFARGSTSLISRELAKRVKAGKPYRTDFFHGVGADMTPTQRMFVEAWISLQHQFAYMRLPLYGSYQRTFPLSDRDLLSFLINVPRTQIIRAGERRSLMRRSLDSLVPREVLWRKNKANSVRKYMRIFAQHSAEIRENLEQLTRGNEIRYVDSKRAEIALSRACNGIAKYNWPVMRMIGLHTWLQASNSYISHDSQGLHNREVVPQPSIASIGPQEHRMHS